MPTLTKGFQTLFGSVITQGNVSVGGTPTRDQSTSNKERVFISDPCRRKTQSACGHIYRTRYCMYRPTMNSCNGAFEWVLIGGW
jgi:hypothetical protein